MPPQTIFTTQTYAPGHYVWPNESGNRVPNNNNTAQVIMNSSGAVVPVGTTVSVTFYLSWDRGASWSSVGQINVYGDGQVLDGDVITIPFEDSTTYKIAIDVTGSTVTLGAQVNLV